MKNKTFNIKITIIALICIIISLIFIILNMQNKNIEEQKLIKEKLGEATTDNAYITLEAHNSELNNKQQEINNMQNIATQATATESQILKDYTAYKDGKLITGTMANNGAVTKTLNAGESYTIPIGYHNGNGKVIANSLASQTSATATESDIAKGKTAWVNGTLITGNNIPSGTVSDTDYISYQMIDHYYYACTVHIPVSGYSKISIYADEGIGYFHLKTTDGTIIHTPSSTPTEIDVSNYDVLKIEGSKTSGSFHRYYIKYLK